MLAELGGGIGARRTCHAPAPSEAGAAVVDDLSSGATAGTGETMSVSVCGVYAFVMRLLLLVKM